jgi:hypothetical protein
MLILAIRILFLLQQFQRVIAAFIFILYLKMTAADSSENFGTVYQTTWFQVTV